MSDLSDYLGPNAGYVLELYERYRRDPASVDPQSRALFATWTPPEAVAAAPAAQLTESPTTDLIVGTSNLARAIRAYGHLAARLDPLGTPPPGDPSLELATFGLEEGDLSRLSGQVAGGTVGSGAPSAAVAIAALRRLYCGTSGYEFRHIQSNVERTWLQDMVESQRLSEPHEPIDRRQVLRELSAVEAFERFLHRSFPGQKRFSIEGVDVLVPVLLEFIGCAAESGTESVWLGMAHRGRLSVLSQVLGKPLPEIFGELRSAGAAESVPPSERDDRGWNGDVTYHLGARTAYQDGRPVGMLVSLAPNPSHLEYVNPVVEGMCRAADERRDRRGAPVQNEQKSISLLVHGDAAFPGEGVVAETLNLSRLVGYRTGGTIHIITNNQLGFTTPPASGRSTLYASDLAKGFEIPIIHVNADDPEACIAAIRLAHAYRERFHKDFLIDIIGYRRWGHNEGDEPTFTQPLMYQRIQHHPTVRALYAERLARSGEVAPSEAQRMLDEATARYRAAFAITADIADGAAAIEETRKAGPPILSPVTDQQLRRLNEQLHTLPSGFSLNGKLARWIERRRGALDDSSAIDWGHAEALAFATLLADGTPIRLTGQDSGRGTFSQRHLVLHDVQTGATFTPLQVLPDAQASFEVHDSPLAEAAVLGFEYGYSTQAHNALVLWEAQFGDFANSAQVLIDQFIAAGEAKWGQTSGLVLLLPHGLEGQGPEHSSARIERFLELAAQDNLRIANCSTAAQYFHLLRRHAGQLREEPRPLIVFTPKGLLRHPLAASRLSDLSQGEFQPVIDDVEARRRADEIDRLILCSGRVYVDLASSPEREANGGAAIVRIEQLYPFPSGHLAELRDVYPRLREVVWVQEEPRNMGPWTFVAPRLREIFEPKLPLTYVGRGERASPAVGAHDLYRSEQQQLVRDAFLSHTSESTLPVAEVSHAG
ncbi:MAG TPA: 2-oxoglutarate dehydrogenase E1 component [Chloroflexota bacterium]|nr:2-oxoglutarate dehydrogenase E1 component [Chloroflexota bacterium]